MLRPGAAAVAPLLPVQQHIRSGVGKSTDAVAHLVSQWGMGRGEGPAVMGGLAFVLVRVLVRVLVCMPVGAYARRA